MPQPLPAELDKVIAVKMSRINGNKYCEVTFKNSTQLKIISYEQCRLYFPEELIDYFESTIEWIKNKKLKKQKFKNKF